MTDTELNVAFEALPADCKIDANYYLYKQADAVSKAFDEDIENGSPTARDDKILFVIGSAQYEIGCWSADVCNAVFTLLHDIKEYAIDELLR